MDTDGYVDEFGRCDLTTVTRARSPSTLRARSPVSGFGRRSPSKRAVLDGRDCGPKYEIQFTPDRPVFRLPRKLARQKQRGRVPSVPRDRGRARRAESVPVRCIEVSSPDGLFLVTQSYVPTHNSSLGRLGLLIHSTAGFIDPGWDGHVTLELSNVANLPITIYPGMKIGQLSFMQMTEPAAAPYGVERARLEVPGPARADAEPLLEELRGRSSTEVLVTGGNGLRRVADRARAPGARRATCACSSGGPSARRRALASWGAELAAGDVTDAESVAPRRRRLHARRAPRRDHPRQRRRLPRVMVEGFANVLAAAREEGVAARRADERARHERGRRRTSCRTDGAKWRMEQDARRLRARVRDLPAELRLRPGRRHPADVRARRCGYSPVVTVIGAGPAAARSRSGSTTSPRTSRAGSTSPAPRTARSSSAAPTASRWNEPLPRASRGVLGKRRRARPRPRRRRADRRPR